MTATLLIISWIALGLVNIYIEGLIGRIRDRYGYSLSGSCLYIIFSPFIFIVLTIEVLWMLLRVLFVVVWEFSPLEKIYNMGNKK